MSTYLFSLAMSQVSDRYVEEALTYQAAVRTRRRVWLRYLGAACLTLVLGFGLALTVSADTRDAVFGWIKEQLCLCQDRVPNLQLQCLIFLRIRIGQHMESYHLICQAILYLQCCRAGCQTHSHSNQQSNLP